MLLNTCLNMILSLLLVVGECIYHSIFIVQYFNTSWKKYSQNSLAEGNTPNDIPTFIDFKLQISSSGSIEWELFQITFHTEKIL